MQEVQNIEMYWLSKLENKQSQEPIANFLETDNQEFLIQTDLIFVINEHLRALLAQILHIIT
jgi:hypothetical protein